jgi:hypothetical protein
MAQRWRKNGATMAQEWRNDGATMAQRWRNDGARMAQEWRRTGAGMAARQEYLTILDHAGGIIDIRWLPNLAS